MSQLLNEKILLREASRFSKVGPLSTPSLYGVTDGKAVGTYLEHKFTAYLKKSFSFTEGNSAYGIDFPKLKIDVKTTSITQPQSSCPFKSARQKIFGLGYSLLVFVYEKKDDSKRKIGILDIKHVVFVDKSRTADYQITSEINKILKNNGNRDDLIALMQDKNLPVDNIEIEKIAEEILRRAPKLGYLTISNALQWRLQYSRIIQNAGKINGIKRVK